MAMLSGLGEADNLCRKCHKPDAGPCLNVPSSAHQVARVSMAGLHIHLFLLCVITGKKEGKSRVKSQGPFSAVASASPSVLACWAANSRADLGKPSTCTAKRPLFAYLSPFRPAETSYQNKACNICTSCKSTPQLKCNTMQVMTGSQHAFTNHVTHYTD